MNVQRDLSEVFIPPQTFLRLGSLFEGKGHIDDRLKFSSYDQVHHFFEFAHRAHGRTEDTEMFGE